MLLSGVWIMQEVEEIDSEAARRKSHLERGGGGIRSKVRFTRGLKAGQGKRF